MSSADRGSSGVEPFSHHGGPDLPAGWRVVRWDSFFRSFVLQLCEGAAKDTVDQAAGKRPIWLCDKPGHGLEQLTPQVYCIIAQSGVSSCWNSPNSANSSRLVATR